MKRILCMIAFGLLFGLPAHAETTIAILDFELNDLTYYPNLPEEVERTASLKSLLESQLANRPGYRLVTVKPEDRAAADKGVGYVYDHHDVATELGEKAGARWLVVGRVHKASYLFVYFKAQLIDTRSRRYLGEFIVEVKGPQQKLTVKGVESLAEFIDAAIRKQLSVNASLHTP
jgi:hypothetical protein